MTAQTFPATTDCTDGTDFADPVGAVDRAREHIHAGALRASGIGQVGLELEFHLVDLVRPERRPEWSAVTAAAASLPPMPNGSSVTLEPGGQIELSTPPTDGIAASATALREDTAVLRAGLAAAGFGAAALGTDPARPTRRINPAQRYVAMETHFAALGCAGPGLAMMTGTAALQVNLDAGPAAGWSDRLSLITALGPVFVTLSAASPWLAGERSGWHSMRQQIWHGIDHGRSDPVAAAADPTDAWASYALDAPVMLVRGEDGSAVPLTERVSFAAWLAGTSPPLGRRPTRADLDYHLTTLFPPVRPKGYLEIRCLDALPERWWPAVAAVVTTLLDGPATDAAAALAEPVAGRWTEAAQRGMQDPELRRAVVRAVELALTHAPPELRSELADLAELVTSGRVPGDELRARADSDGPLRLLQEAARA